MTQWAKKRVKELEKEDLFGFVFKKKNLQAAVCLEFR
jgi:hypothetical protein